MVKRKGKYRAAPLRVQFYYEHNKVRRVRWRMLGRNNKVIVASTEGFATRDSAKRNFNLLRKLLALPALRIERRTYAT